MPQSISTLLADVFLFVETAAESEEAQAALAAVGYGDAHHSAGRELVELGSETLLDVAAELETDTTLIHLIHTAATEVEMWQYALRTKVASAVSDELGFILGEHLHAEDHTMAVIAQTRRTLGLLQTHTGLRDALGASRQIEDQFQRGTVLLNRLVKLSDQQVDLEDHRIAEPALPAVRARLNAWLDASLDMAKRAFAGKPELHGAIGRVPEGLKDECGGAAKQVVRHQHAARTAPSKIVTRGPGWGLGRQGRNKENVGGGY